MMNIDPYGISARDKAKLLAVYERLCPDDLIADDDPRAPLIAAEVLEVGRAPTVKEALAVIEWWRQPQDWSAQFVNSVRRSVCKMKLETPNVG